ncbi:hypothetical protein [Kutzneria sp. NPDC051319]|uniref:restriction system modified-DNA reader domain-containing protein n=1 Tax=Kutzneria sp. NPDC051319 TaxID=3155047 RepID=UPI00343C19AA
MPIDHSTPDTPESPASAAVVARASAHRANHAIPGADTAHIDGETALREWEGLPPDTRILFPAFATPMGQPGQTCALLVQAVGITADGDQEELELVAGSWLTGQALLPADLHDGDLVVRITPLDNTVDAVDLEMLLAHHGRWHRVGAWLHLGSTWPVILAPTAATVMGLSTDIAEAAARHNAAAPSTSPLAGPNHGGVSALLDARLVKPGEEFLWERRNNGVRHIARVRADGAVVLADGRVFATPSGAATALGGYAQNGWGVFRRVSDGRPLSGLRTDLRMRRGQ